VPENLNRISKYTQGSDDQFRSLSGIVEPHTPAEEEYDYGDITGYAYESVQLPSNNNLVSKVRFIFGRKYLCAYSLQHESTSGIMSKLLVTDLYKNSKNGECQINIIWLIAIITFF